MSRTRRLSLVVGQARSGRIDLRLQSAPEKLPGQQQRANSRDTWRSNVEGAMRGDGRQVC